MLVQTIASAALRPRLLDQVRGLALTGICRIQRSAKDAKKALFAIRGYLLACDSGAVFCQEIRPVAYPAAMALKTSQVYRCLEKKMLIFGFEIVDLFAIFSFLAFLNLVMQGVPYKFCVTWGPAMALAIFLRLGKAGKPENHLLHL